MSRTARLGAVVFAIVMMQGLVACGGSSDDATDSSTSDTAAAADSGGSSDASDDGGSDSSASGDLDCDALMESLTAATFPLQILAQLQTADQWELITEGTLTFDAAAFQAGVEGLRPLESLPGASADLSEGLDLYAEAGALAAEAQESPDPATSEAGVALAALTEDTQTFLFYQADIAQAVDEADC